MLSTNVDKSVDIIVRALYGAAACMVKTVGHKKKRATDWFDQECARMKKLVKRQLCKFRRTNNREDREKYVNDRREYKRLLMKKKTEFDEERLRQLKQNFNNPSKFWETIRSINRKSTIYNSITSELVLVYLYIVLFYIIWHIYFSLAAKTDLFYLPLSKGLF